MNREHFLENRVPPPLVALACLILMAWLASVWPRGAFSFPGQWVLAGVIVVIGLAIAGAAILQFRRLRTTVNPLRPETVSALVAGGPFRFSRNPMYLGMAVILLGAAVGMGNLLALIGPFVFAAWITRFQIAPEERALQAAFGPGFAEYSRRVRRWV